MKALLFTFAAIVCSSVCHAQSIEQFFRKSPLQTAVEQSISPGLYVIRQDYVLRKNSTGEFFTRNNAPEFSSTYSLAVKASGGYYVSETAAMPWKYDGVFIKLSKPDNYTPVISKTMISHLQEKASYAAVDTGSLKAVQKMRKLFFISDTLSDKSEFVPFVGSADEFFTLWVTVPDTVQLSSSTALRFIFNTVAANEVSAGNVNLPNTDDKILGGLLIATDSKNIGVLECQLAGLMVCDGSNWRYAMLPKPNKPKPTKSDETIELTPVKSGVETDNPKNKNNRKRK